MLIFILFYWFDQKNLLKQIQIFLRICPFSNMLRKTNFLSISVLVSEIVILCLKRKVLYEFLQKCFKERHKVCGLLLEKNKLNFPQDLPLFKHAKENKLSEYFSACFWDSHFMSKKKSSLWISPKMLQNNERLSLAVFGLLCG